MRMEFLQRQQLFTQYRDAESEQIIELQQHGNQEYGLYEQQFGLYEEESGLCEQLQEQYRQLLANADENAAKEREKY